MWIQLLEKEKIKLDRYADYDWDTKLSDCSDDSFSSDDLWLRHINEHDPDNMYYVRGRNPMDMCREDAECNHGYLIKCFFEDRTKQKYIFQTI